MMNCARVTRSAGDFLERKLRLRDRLAVLLHVAMCRGCRAYLEQMRLSIRALGALRAPAAEVAGIDSLLDRFRRELEGGKS